MTRETKSRRRDWGPVIGRLPHLERRMRLSYERFADPRLWKGFADELGITVRELQVALLLVKGLSLQEVAQSLQISKGTVRTYNVRLHAKLRVVNRGEMVVTLLLGSGLLLKGAE